MKAHITGDDCTTLRTPTLVYKQPYGSEMLRARPLPLAQGARGRGQGGEGVVWPGLNFLRMVTNYSARPPWYY